MFVFVTIKIKFKPNNFDLTTPSLKSLTESRLQLILRHIALRFYVSDFFYLQSTCMTCIDLHLFTISGPLSSRYLYPRDFKTEIMFERFCNHVVR